MRKGLILLFLASCSAAGAQTIPLEGAQLIPSKEAFLNEVFRNIIDSTAPKYYLAQDAYPCGFIKYDYDEWFKYNLKEDVPIYILNELAGKCYHDRTHLPWRQDSLVKAICVNPRKADSIIYPFFGHARGKLSMRHINEIQKKLEALHRLTPEETVVYDLSKPEFSDDGQYAIMDVIVDCGDLCASKYTCLFRRTGPGTWKLIGNCLDWQS